MKRLFVVNQMVVNVMLPSDELELWNLLWHDKSVRGGGPAKQCYNGIGWYNFVETLVISYGHCIRFCSQSAEYFLRIEIVESGM